MGIGKIKIDHTADLVAIAESAGQCDPESRWYDAGVFYVRGVTDKALVEAVARINAPEAVEEREIKARIAAIKSRLLELDTESIRPLRSLLSGDGLEDDKVRLQGIEGEAARLRHELRELMQGNLE